MLDSRPGRPRVTIARLMIAVAGFAGLFALPVGFACLIVFIAACIAFVWVSAATIAAVVKRLSGSPPSPRVIATIAGAATLLDVTGWSILTLALRVPPTPESFPQLTVSLVAAGILGTLAFILALGALLCGPDTHAVRWKVLAILPLLTAWPLSIVLGVVIFSTTAYSYGFGTH